MHPTGELLLVPLHEGVAKLSHEEHHDIPFPPLPAGFAYKRRVQMEYDEEWGSAPVID